MMRLPFLLAALVSSLVAATSAAGVFTVTEPWIRPAPAGATTNAYMELASSEGATVVEARSPVAGRVILVAGKRREPAPFGLVLPPRQPVALAPGGTSLALERLAHPLRLGERVPLILVVRNDDGTTQNVDVDAEVRRRSPSDDHHVPHKR